MNLSTECLVCKESLSIEGTSQASLDLMRQFNKEHDHPEIRELVKIMNLKAAGAERAGRDMEGRHLRLAKAIVDAGWRPPA